MSEASSPDAETGSDRRHRRDWSLFYGLNIAFAFGFAVYSGVFQNFMRDVLHAGPQQLGNLESLREIPGLLAAVMAGTLVALAETRIASLGLFVMAIGIGLSGSVPTYDKLILITVFWSVGFHLWSSVAPAITLALAKGLQGGYHLGRISGIANLATLGALGASFVLSRLLPRQDYLPYFVIGGLSIAVASFLCSRLSANAHGAPRSRLVLRKKYGLYYLLIFLEGCRRQIFGIFATFALIMVYKQPLAAMLAVQFANSLLIAFTAPLIGRLTDKIGERRPLTFYSIALIVVFFGYTHFEMVGALYALYLVDNILFGFGVGYTTYLHRIAEPSELTPCLAMGTTMNHIAAVTVPAGGAWLWAHYGNYKLPFYVGIIIAFVALIATQFLPARADPVRA